MLRKLLIVQVYCLLALALAPLRGSALELESKRANYGFRQNYVVFEFTKAFPYSHSQRNYTGGEISELYGFRHVMNDEWIMGVFAGFKQIVVNETSNKLSLFSMGMESMYLWRLFHPFYLTIGGKLFFVYPTQNKRIPLEHDPNINRETAAGITSGLYYIVNKRVAIGARIDRWRGLSDHRFHMVETAVNFSYSLP